MITIKHVSTGETLIQTEADTLCSANLSGADLRGANLSGANLSGADLSSADLSGANLSGADLRGANLSGADLRIAYLCSANLCSANLSSAYLCSANLRIAYLSSANLSSADLSSADLSSADLSSANLSGANLSKTCLDPENAPNSPTGFEPIDGGFVVGYRTRKAGHIDKYRDGRIYSADWFSTADTDCHPGLYLWPTLQQAKDYTRENCEYIKVKTRQSDIHKAGGKYRCRWFEVIGTAKGGAA